MPATQFQADGILTDAYLALPHTGSGPGVLVLHAWWGLNDFFKQFCDRLAAEGFVAFAPDLCNGQIAQTIDEAQAMMEARDFTVTQKVAEAALAHLQAHSAVEGDTLRAIGFSMGAAFAILLDSLHPHAIDRIVLFYGGSDMEFAGTTARYQGHFAEVDAWEPAEAVDALADQIDLHRYPGTGHWFFEADRPDAYNADAAQEAWRRSVDFLS